MMIWDERTVETMYTVEGETPEGRRLRGLSVSHALIRNVNEIPTVASYARVYASLGLPAPTFDELLEQGMPVRANTDIG